MRFEDEEIDVFSVKIRQYTGYIDIPLMLGEIVELSVLGRVVSVDHRENQKTHELVRVHEIMVDDAVVQEELVEDHPKHSVHGGRDDRSALG